MAKKFSISENMLSGISKNTKKVSTLKAKENFKLEYIDIENIIPSEKNFYELTDIDDLAEDILINGLNHNLVVRPLVDGKYEIISGERRYTAIKKLIDQGKEQFKTIPCKVKDLNDLDAEIVLIQANAQSRELTDADKLKQIQRLTTLYNIKKSKGEKVGKIREKISNDTGLSQTQVGRYTTINKGLIPELKLVLEKGNLSIANASEFATLSVENQNLILELINNRITINKNEAKDLKNKFKELEKYEKDLLNKQESLNDAQDIKIELNEKARAVIDDFEKNKRELENNNLIDNKNEVESKNSSKELKINLKKLKKDIEKVTSLMSYNSIVDENTLNEIKSLEVMLRSLNKQINLYTK